MAPFAYAVGFIDGDADQLPLSVNSSKGSSERVCLAKFRCYIEKPNPWVSREHVIQDYSSFYL